MCRVRGTSSLRRFGWCWVDTPVSLVVGSLAPWPAPLSFLLSLSPLLPLSLDPYLDGLLFGLAFWALWSGAGVGACVGAFKGVQALQARGQFSRLLRQPSDPRTATVMASKRGGRTLILDINPGGYQPLSEVRLALWTKAEMLMPGESVTVYGRPGAREPAASQQRTAGPGVPRHGDEPVDRPAPGRLTRR